MQTDGVDPSAWDRIPSISGLPLIGSALDIKKDRLGFLQEIARHNEDIVHFRLGTLHAVLLNNAEFAGQVLAETGQSIAHHRPGGRGALARLLGNGFPYRDGATYKQHRKMFNSLFQQRAVVRHATTIADIADEAQRRWHNGSLVELYTEMADISFKALINTFLKIDDQGDASEIRRLANVVLDQIVAESSSVFPLPAWLPTPERVRLKENLHKLHAVTDRVIHAARRSSNDGQDLLSLLLRYQDESGRRMTVPQIRDDLVTFLLAGHETSAVSLCWTFYLLMRHTEKYQHLQQEAASVLGNKAPDTPEQLKSLEFNLQVVKETLRMYPSISVLKRWAIRAIRLGEYDVPAGTLIVICPYLLHRRAKYFSEPSQFLPERFTPDMERNLPRSAYIPFGDGPRICIGWHFAMFESEIVLATLTNRVTFELVPGQQISPDGNATTLRPRNGIWARVRRRDQGS